MNRRIHALVATALLSAVLGAHAQEATPDQPFAAVMSSSVSREAIRAEVLALRHDGRLESGDEGPGRAGWMSRRDGRARIEVQAETLNALRQAAQRPYAERWAQGQV